MSPLAVHWGAKQKLLTPWLRKGPVITLISCREERERKAARIIERKWEGVFERKRSIPISFCSFTDTSLHIALAEATGDKHAYHGREHITSVTKYVICLECYSFYV